MRRYFLMQAIRRRWKPALATILLLLVVRFAFWRPVPTLYRTELSFIVSTQALDSTLVTEEEKYYLWLSSEYVVASISDYLNGGDFANLISVELLKDGFAEMDSVTTDEFVSAGYVRSRLIIAITHPEEAMVTTISDASVRALFGLNLAEFAARDQSFLLDLPVPQLERSPAYLFPIDSELFVEQINLRQNVIRDARNRVLSAILGGLVVIFLAEWRDPTIRSLHSAEKLRIPIIGEIPSKIVNDKQ